MHNTTTSPWDAPPYQVLRRQAVEQQEQLVALTGELAALLERRLALLIAVESEAAAAGLSPLPWRELVGLWGLGAIEQANDRLELLIDALAEALAA